MLAFAKVVSRVLAAVVAGLAIVLAAAAWWLSSGPVALGFVAPYLADALTAATPGLSAEIEAAELGWSENGRSIDLRALNVRLRRPDGTLVATVPELSMAFSGRALLYGRLAPISLDLRGVTVRLVRDAAGRFEFRGAEAGENGSSNLVATLVEELSQPQGGGFAGYLERASILDATVVLEDRRLGTTWIAEEAAVGLRREVEGMVAELIARVPVEDGSIALSAAATYHAVRQSIDLSLNVRGVHPAVLADRLPVLAPLQPLDLPISGEVSFTLERSGAISALRFDLAAGEGRLLLAELGNFSLPVHAAAVRGSVADDLQMVRLDGVTLDTGDFTLAGSGAVTFGDSGPGLAVSARIPHLTTQAVTQYWPAEVGRNAREWILANIQGGVLEAIELQANVPPGALQTGELADEAVQLDFRFSGLGVTYFRPLPKLDEVSGRAHMNAERIVLQVAHGRVGDLVVDGATVTVAGFKLKDQDADIVFDVSGPAQDALRLLDHPPLGFAKDLDIAPADVTGFAATHARFAFPLRKDLKLQQVRIDAKSELTGLGVANAFGRFQLSDGRLTVTVDTTRMEAVGNLAIDGAAVSIRWREEFRPQGRFSSLYRIAGVLQDDDRRRLGMAAGTYLSGPTPVELTVESNRRGEVRVEGQADLETATLTVPELRWGKPPGSPGMVTVSVTAASGQPVEIGSFAVTAGDLAAAGSGRLSDGGIDRLTIDRLAFGETDLTAEIAARAAGGFAVELRGPSLDLRPYLDDVTSDNGDDAADGPPIAVAFHLDRVIAGDSAAVTGLTGRALRRNGRLQELQAAGRLATGGDLKLQLGPQGARRRLTLTASDAGAVLQALDISENVVGGRLELNGVFLDELPEVPMQGHLRLSDFTVVEAPVLARILTLGSLTGIGEILSGDGIGFVRAEVPFTLTGPLVTVRKGRAWGPAIGFTSEGTVDLRQQHIALNGTIVPSYTLNTVLGSIPLLGNLLVSREGEGVFGITYRVSGNLEDPQVVVNPLSALAPGILRRMFEPAEEGETSRPPRSADESGLPAAR